MKPVFIERAPIYTRQKT